MQTFVWGDLDQDDPASGVGGQQWGTADCPGLEKPTPTPLAGPSQDKSCTFRKQKLHHGFSVGPAHTSDPRPDSVVAGSLPSPEQTWTWWLLAPVCRGAAFYLLWFCSLRRGLGTSSSPVLKDRGSHVQCAQQGCHLWLFRAVHGDKGVMDMGRGRSC